MSRAARREPGNVYETWPRIRRLALLDALIGAGARNMSEIAQAMELSRRHVNRLANELREVGAPVEYDPVTNAVRYARPFSLAMAVEAICREAAERAVPGTPPAALRACEICGQPFDSRGRRRQRVCFAKACRRRKAAVDQREGRVKRGVKEAQTKLHEAQP